MLVFRVGKVMVLWMAVLALSTHAYFRSVAASTIDTRFFWALPIILGALLIGHLLSWAVGRLAEAPPPRLGADRHGLCLLVATLCVDALSHVEPATTIRVLREEVPGVLGWIYPAITLITPLMLRVTSTRRSAADQGLWIALCLTSLSGALVLMDAPTALCLGFVALLLQLDAGRCQLPRNLLLILSSLVVGLLLLSSWTGTNALHATPSRAWILAAASGGLAIAIRPRQASDWRWILSAPLAAAILVALSGFIITIFLGLQVAWKPALDTRLTLFRQHPNFLAPFLGFQSLVALGLALSGKRFRLLGLACSALLAVSTIMTDSRTGQGALGLSLLAIPSLYTMTLVTKRFRLRVLVAITAGILAIAGALFLFDGMGNARSKALDMASQVERFDKSMDYRVDAWQNSLEIIEGHPWIGIGPGTFISEHRFEPGSRFFNEPRSPHPHNVVLYVGQAAGIPAALLFLFWVVILLQSQWRSFMWRPHPVPRFLMATLIAATIGILAASLLDLGLALNTVVPAPLYILTGLMISTRTQREPTTREGPALFWLAPIAVLFVFYGFNAVRAKANLEQGKLLWYMAGQRRGNPEVHKENARKALRRAIDLNPDLYLSYDLLARWTEREERGFFLSQSILEALVARADTYGPSLSQLGHLYMRHRMYEQAADWLQRSLDCSHGSIHLTRDRANLILCLARLGRREECLSLIANSLQMDVGIIDELPFVSRPNQGGQILPLGGSEPQQPIRLVEAAEVLFAMNIAAEEADQPVGRRFWMDTYNAFRRAGHDDKASMVLDYLEQNEVINEPHTIAYERGRLALDADDLQGGLTFFEFASSVAPRHVAPFFDAESSRVRRLMGETTVAVEETKAAFTQGAEILDVPELFQGNLEQQASMEIEQGSPSKAARLLERTLLYTDDLQQRGRLWERIGNLYASGDQPQDAERAIQQALLHLSAKPFGLTNLQLGVANSISARLALTLCTVWRANGLDAGEIQQAASKLPGFYSPRMAPSLLRMAIYNENGQAQALLHEADLQLLRDPNNFLAMWARLDAFENMGRWQLARDSMRNITEQYGLQYDLENIYQQAVTEGMSRIDDANAWFEVGILDLLRGRYSEAAGIFENAFIRMADQAHQSAHMLSWQARATQLASHSDAQERTRTLLMRGIELAPDCAMLQSRLNGLAP
jgi:O-antigen ligase/tetratricopeptide (TPR) repeat protein